MSRLRRFEKDGALFTDAVDSVADLRNRSFVVSGNPILSTFNGFKCITFDGTDYIFSNHNQFSLAGNFTLSFWVNTTTTSTANARIFDLAQSASSGTTITMRGDDGSYRISVDNSGGPTTTIQSTQRNLNDGKWHHVVVTRTTTTYRIYVDSLLSVSTSGGTAPNYTRISMGALIDGSAPWIGSIRDVILFNRVFTQTEISDIYNEATFNYMDGLVSYWEMSEINPQDMGYKDYRYNGTGTSIAFTDIVPGQNSTYKAITFDGANSKVAISTDFIGTGPISIVAWANPTSAGEGSVGRIIDNGRLIVRCGGSTTIVFASDGSATTSAAANTFPLSTWTCIGITRNSSGTANFYINGAASGTADQASGTPAAGITALTLGNNAAQGATFSGKIGPIYVFSSVLTEIQIRDLYESAR